MDEVDVVGEAKDKEEMDWGKWTLIPIFVDGFHLDQSIVPISEWGLRKAFLGYPL